MGLINDFKWVYKALKERRELQTNKYRVEYAFTCGGTDYFQFADINNLPYERGLSALCVYNEVEMRCSRDFLTRYTKAIDEVLNNDKHIDLYMVKQLNEMLKQRLQLTADVDLLYKLASIVFFDASENPYVWEQGYAEKKIAKWKKDKNVTSFFLQKPLSDLMPFLRNVNTDLDIYTKLNEELNELHEQTLHLASSIKERKNTKAGKK